MKIQLNTDHNIEGDERVAEFVTSVEDGLWFEALSLTRADQERATQYNAERQRETAFQSAQTLPDYLTSLDMKGVIQEIDEADLKRVVQLLGKTNQSPSMNKTTLAQLRIAAPTRPSPRVSTGKVSRLISLRT